MRRTRLTFKPTGIGSRLTFPMKWEVIVDNSMQSGTWRRVGICMKDPKIKTKKFELMRMRVGESPRKM